MTNEKGNAALIVILVALVAVGGLYLFSSGKLNLNSMQSKQEVASNYVLATSTPNSSGAVSTSNKISLSIISPANGITLNSPSVKISGKTSPNAEVFVNDVSTKADANGNFSVNVTLDEGQNDVTVTANDEEGNVAEQSFSVNIQTF